MAVRAAMSKAGNSYGKMVIYQAVSPPASSPTCQAVIARSTSFSRVHKGSYMLRAKWQTTVGFTKFQEQFPQKFCPPTLRRAMSSKVFAVREDAGSLQDEQVKSKDGGPAQLAYVVMYVPDVAKSAEFYSKAFGLKVRRIDSGRRWAELETGSTTLAFTPLEQHETEIIGGVQAPSFKRPGCNIEVCLDFLDLEAAFKYAVKYGAKSVAEPEDKEWGQKVAYVRDLDGNVVRLGSHVNKKP